MSLIREAYSVDANASYIHHHGMTTRLRKPQLPPQNATLRDILAYRIRLHRVEKGWSQERLALECELDRTYVSAVERSRWNVSLANIERIASVLDVEPWTLLVPPN